MSADHHILHKWRLICGNEKNKDVKRILTVIVDCSTKLAFQSLEILNREREPGRTVFGKKSTAKNCFSLSFIPFFLFYDLFLMLRLFQNRQTCVKLTMAIKVEKKLSITFIDELLLSFQRSLSLIKSKVIAQVATDSCRPYIIEKESSKQFISKLQKLLARMLYDMRWQSQKNIYLISAQVLKRLSVF